MYRRHLLGAAVACLWGATALTASAQQFPSKPVRIIVPATAGTSDVLSRALALRLAPALGQPVLIEQKPGAGTNMGNDFVAKSAPDGHTMLINGLPLVANEALYGQLPYNTMRDLTPVIEVAEVANIITAHPSLPVNSLRELVQMAKNEPNRLNYGTPGAGSSGHLSAELLGVKTGGKFTHVPYQGNAQATNDHLSGVLQVGFVNMPVGLQFVKAGRLKALAVTSAKRSPHLPDVPTVAEAGHPEALVQSWYGIAAPAKTPADIQAYLADQFMQTLAQPATRAKLEGIDAEIMALGADPFNALIASEYVRWGELIRKRGIKMPG